MRGRRNTAVADEVTAKYTKKMSPAKLEATARVIYAYLQTRKNKGYYLGYTASEDVGLPPWEYYTGLGYLRDKGIVTLNGKKKTENGYETRFSIKDADIRSLFNELGQSVAAAETKKEERPMEGDQLTMELPGVNITITRKPDTTLATLDEIDGLIDQMLNLVGQTKKLEEELRIAKSNLIAEKEYCKGIQGKLDAMRYKLYGALPSSRE